MYLGGDFSICGNVDANYIARWDPQLGTFSSLGSGAANGVNQPVFALAVLGTSVYAGGGFTQAGGQTANRVARFDTATGQWSSLGTGAANGLNFSPQALTISGTDVYVGGSFNMAGGQPANNVARFDTVLGQWFPLGSGASNGVNQAVLALTVVGDDVWVGGQFSQAGGQAASAVARFNKATGTWSSLGSGAANGVGAGGVRAIAVTGADVYVGGFFLFAGGQAANRIARFSTTLGQWFTLGSGIATGSVYDLEVTGGDLYVGGGFAQAGGQSVNNAARYDLLGGNWFPVGNGATNGANSVVFAFAVSANDIYAGGQFVQAGGLGANYIARHNRVTGSWSQLGSGTSNGLSGNLVNVASIVVQGADVFAGGSFTQAGGQLVNKIARFNVPGGEWFALGSAGMDGVDGVVNGMAVVGNELYVAGEFGMAGGQPANNVARYHLATGQWSTLGAGATNGVDGIVYALAASATDVFVTGEFTNAGGGAANFVARWNAASGTWSSLGSGTANGLNDFGYAIAASGGDVFVGGGFFLAGGQPVNRIARFNVAGGQWSALGSGANNGVNGDVFVLAASGGNVYAGGGFFLAGGQPANGLARYNVSGAQWSALGIGGLNGTDGSVGAITVSGNDVYVGGAFTQAGAIAANRVARFNTGSGQWFPLGGNLANGVNTSVGALALAGTDLYLGGLFNRAGGKISLRFARYDARRDVTSSATTSPVGAATVNTSVTLSASVATAGFPVQPGTVDFLDGATPIAGCANRPMVGGLDTRTASCGIANLAVGAHSIVARYSGDALNYIGTSDPAALTISAPSIALNPATLPGGIVGTAYDQTITAGGTVAVAPFTYVFSAGTPPPGLTLLSGNGRLLGSPSIAGGFTFTVSAFDSSSAGVGGPFEGTREYTIAIGAANQAPTVTYNPNAGTQVNLPSGSGALNEAVSTQIGLSSNGALGTGNTAVGCGVSAGFTVSPPTITASTSGLNPAASFTVGCNLGQAAVNGALTCTETATPPGSQVTREWPLVCPGAAAVAPTLTFLPDAGNSIVFPDGALNGTGTRTIQVTSSGIVGSGSSSLNCTITQGTGFAIDSGGAQTISSVQSAGPIGLSCTRSVNARTGELTCNETKSPGGAQSPRTWSLQCPAGVVVANSIVSVGTRTGVRNQRVTIPLAFRGDGTTVDFEADVSFDDSKLLFQSVQAVPGATCVRLSGAESNEIRVSAPTTPSPNPLSPNVETRYCDVTFKIASAAVGGFSPMPVTSSRCSDGGGANPPCTTQPPTALGGVGIASVETSLPSGTIISIAGHEGTAEATRTLRITNRGDTPLDFICQVTGPSALGLRTPAGFTIAAQQSSDVLVGCLLPPLGTTLNGQLICDTMDDPVRPRVQFGLSCQTVAQGSPLPGDQIIDNELKAGDQLGTSAAVAMQSAGEVMAIGAPFAGSDSNGRVFILEDSGGGGGGASGKASGTEDATGHPSRWRRLTQLAAPPNVKAADGTPVSFDKFGQAVALSSDGSRAAVGAPFGGVGNAGLVWLFNRPPTGWGDVDFTNPSAAITPPSVSGVIPQEFGDSLAFTPDGDLVIGAPGTSIGTTGVGAAYLFDFTGGIFVPPTSPLTSTQPAGNGRFGDAIAASDKMIVVGAPQEGPMGTKPGTIYGFPLFNGIPDPPTAYRPPDVQPNDNFGSGVAIGGDTVVVGSPGADTTAGIDSGAITVFKPMPDGTLITPTKLIPPPGTAQGTGAAVATNGDVIVVGAPTAAPVNPNTKTGRVLLWDAKSSYTPNEQPIQVLENVGGADQDKFGQAVAAGPRTVVAGVPLDDREIETVNILDIGRADPFVLDRILRAGFE